MTTTRSRLVRSRVVRVGAVIGAAVLLAGCGAARPGVAAQVGDGAISIAEVDDSSVAFCKAYGTANPGNVVPMRVARSFLLSSKVDRLIGEQIAAEYDVVPGQAYEQGVAQARSSVAGLPADQQEAVLDQQTAGPFRQSVVQAAARKLLAQEGVIDPTDDQLQGRASLLETQWTDDHPVEIDPRFSVADDQGQVTSDSLAFPVSQAAKDGAQEDIQALGTYAQSLPASQRCGA